MIWSAKRFSLCQGNLLLARKKIFSLRIRSDLIWIFSPRNTCDLIRISARSPSCQREDLLVGIWIWSDLDLGEISLLPARRSSCWDLDMIGSGSRRDLLVASKKIFLLECGYDRIWISARRSSRWDLDMIWSGSRRDLLLASEKVARRFGVFCICCNCL